MALADMPKQTEALNAAIERLGKRAHGTGQDMEALNKSVFSFTNYTKALLSLGVYEAVLKPFSTWAVQQVKSQKELIQGVKERLNKEQQHLENLVTERKFMLERGAFSKDALALQKQALDLQTFEVYKLQEEAKFRIGIVESFGKFAKVSLVTGAITLAWTEKMLRTSHELNRALISTDSSLGNRLDLMNKVLGVQQELGADTGTMAEAAKVLVEYGAHLGPAFGQSLKTVVMLRDGLGVAASTGAELVTIFTQQLKTGAEHIGNVMAQVAHQTGLSAERAAQFAIEIGKSLRLLGPGFRSEAAGVTAVIEKMAARINKLGGNAHSVIDMFRRMSGGKAEAFFLRGLAGVQSGQLGTSAGAEAAMQNLAAQLRAMVGPAPTTGAGMEFYQAKIEGYAEVIGMTSNELVDFLDVMRESNRTVSEAKTLAQAYREQTNLIGDSWKQMREALSSMMTEALLPVLKYIQPVVQGIADFAKWLAKSETFVDVLSIAVPTAAIVASIGIGRLVIQLGKLALTSEFVADTVGRRAISSMALGIKNMWNAIAAQRAGHFLPGAAMSIGRGGFTTVPGSALGVGQTLGWMGPAAGILAAGAAGWAAGAVIRKLLPDTWNDKIGKILYHVAGWHSETINERAALQTRIGNRSTIHWEEEASEVLAKFVAAKATKEELDSAINTAYAAGAQKGISAEAIMSSIAGRAWDVTMDRVNRDEMPSFWAKVQGRPRTKSEQAQTEYDKATLDSLAIQTQQLAQQKKISAASVQQAEAAMVRVRAMAEARDAALFDVNSLEDATNSDSYRH